MEMLDKARLIQILNEKKNGLVTIIGDPKLFTKILKMIDPDKKNQNTIYRNMKHSKVKWGILKTKDRMVISEARFFQQLRTLVPQSNELSVIEVGLAEEILTGKKTVAILPFLQSTCLKGRKFYLDKTSRSYDRNVDLIQSNGGVITNDIEENCTVVITGEDKPADRAHTEKILTALIQKPKISLKGLEWIDELGKYNDALPNNFVKQDHKTAALLEPFRFYLTEKGNINDEDVKIARMNKLGLQTTDSVTGGCVVLHDENYSKISDITKELIACALPLILKPTWLATVIRQRSIFDYSPHTVKGISLPRFSSLPSYSSAKVHVLDGKFKKDILTLVPVLGGQITDQDFNLVVCSESVMQDYDDHVQLATYTCLEKYAEELFPHNCSFVCIPTPVQKWKNVLSMDGKTRSIALLVSKEEDSYLKAIVPQIGGFITENMEEASTVFVNASKVSPSQLSLIQGIKGHICSSSYFSELIIEGKKPSFSKHEISPDLESIFSDETLEFNLSQTIRIDIEPLPDDPPHTIRSHAHQSAQVPLSDGEQTSEPLKIDELSQGFSFGCEFKGRAYFVQRLVDALGLFGIQFGAFEAGVSSDNRLSFDIVKTLKQESLSYGTGICIIHNQEEKEIPRILTAVHKSRTDSSRDAILPKIIRVVCNSLQTLGVTCAVARDKSITLVYSRNGESKTVLVGKITNVNTEGVRGLQIVLYENIMGCIQTNVAIPPEIQPIHVVFQCVNHNYHQCSCNPISDMIRSWKTIRSFCTHSNSIKLRPTLTVQISQYEDDADVAGQKIPISEIQENLLLGMIEKVEKKIKEALLPVPVTCVKCSQNVKAGLLVANELVCAFCKAARATNVPESQSGSQVHSNETYPPIRSSSLLAAANIIDMTNEVSAAIKHFGEKGMLGGILRERHTFLSKKLKFENYSLDAYRTLFFLQKQDKFYLHDLNLSERDDVYVVCVICCKALNAKAKKQPCNCKALENC